MDNSDKPTYMLSYATSLTCDLDRLELFVLREIAELLKSVKKSPPAGGAKTCPEVTSFLLSVSGSNSK